jgi:hypothetical protein
MAPHLSIPLTLKRLFGEANGDGITLPPDRRAKTSGTSKA